MFKPYKMRCPKCKTPVAIKKESYIGRKVACKGCSAKFVVKAPGKKSSSSGAKTRPRKKVKSEVGQDSEFMLALDKLNLNDKNESLKSLPKAPGRKSNVKRSEEELTRKVKKKADKKKNTTSPLVIIGGTILSAIIIVGVGYLVKDHIPVDKFTKPEAPEQFTWYTDENKSFSMEFPKGWSVTGGGGTEEEPIWARSKFGSVTIEIRDSMSESDKGNISGRRRAPAIGADGKPIPVRDNQKPEAKVHEINLEKAELKYDKYEETLTRTMKSGMGGVRISEFTSSSWVGDYSGIRATYLTPRFQLTLYCDCPNEDIREMKSAFMRIAQSVRSGGPPQ